MPQLAEHEQYLAQIAQESPPEIPPPAEKDLVTIRPGDSLVGILDLTKGYVMQPGTYTLTYHVSSLNDLWSSVPFSFIVGPPSFLGTAARND